jgi:hypothetical protein
MSVHMARLLTVSGGDAGDERIYVRSIVERIVTRNQPTIFRRIAYENARMRFATD